MTTKRNLLKTVRPMPKLRTDLKPSTWSALRDLFFPIAEKRLRGNADFARLACTSRGFRSIYRQLPAHVLDIDVRLTAGMRAAALRKIDFIRREFERIRAVRILITSRVSFISRCRSSTQRRVPIPIAA